SWAWRRDIRASLASYSYMPVSKVPVTVKPRMLGIMPAGVRTPRGDVTITCWPGKTSKCRANSFPRTIPRLAAGVAGASAGVDRGACAAPGHACGELNLPSDPCARDQYHAQWCLTHVPLPPA